MTPAPTAPLVQAIALAAIYPSPTNPRKHFDAAKHAELVDSVKRHNILQPILLRPWNRFPPRGKTIGEMCGTYELVAGERRFRAARAADFATIPAIVRELSDLEVLEIQVVENMQREDLHPLEEAEGYEHLMKDHGYAADDIAAKIGKSKAYIYARLKLTALCDSARQAFYDGRLNPSTALLLARIPSAKLQGQACQEIVKPRYGDGEPLSVRAAQHHLRDHYMLRLAEAVFPVKDAELVPLAGACGTCAKRTSCQPELFAEVTDKDDLCIDPDCYAAKRKAFADRQIAAAREAGRKVLEGKEAKKVAPYEHALDGDFVRLDDKCYDAPPKKNHTYPTYREVLGTAVEPILLRDPHSGDAVEIVRKSAARGVLKDEGITRPEDKAQKKREREAKIEAEAEFRQRLFGELRTRHARTLDNTDGMPTADEVRLIAAMMCRLIDHDSACRIVKLRNPGVKLSGEQVRERANSLRKDLDDMEMHQVTSLLFDLCHASELAVHAYSTAEAERMLATAQRLAVDADAIRKDAVAAARAKDKAKAPKAKPGAVKDGQNSSLPRKAAQANGVTPPAQPRRPKKAAAAQPPEGQEAAQAAPAEMEKPSGRKRRAAAATPGDTDDPAQATPAGNETPDGPADGSAADPLYGAAKEVVRRLGRVAISLVQRHMSIGYNRAARLIEQMEADGIVTPMDRNGERTILPTAPPAADVKTAMIHATAWPFPVGNRPAKNAS